MPTARVSDTIELAYETFGSRDDPPLMLVMGLGSQLIDWDERFCQALADRGFFVVRFDNRDVGLSTKVESDRLEFVSTFTRALAGETVTAPYLLTDMAADAVGLLDVLDLDAAHVVGVSMGGMIAQTMAIEHPTRVRSLTSIMSTTGDRDVGQPTADALQILVSSPPTSRQEHEDRYVATSRVIGSPDHIDEAVLRRKANAKYDRCFFPVGVGRQLLAVVASGSRTEQLRRLNVPTLVIHGDRDTLVDPSGGRRTAEAIPGAELVILEGLGHDLPPAYWERIIDAVCKLAARAA